MRLTTIYVPVSTHPYAATDVPTTSPMEAMVHDNPRGGLPLLQLEKAVDEGNAPHAHCGVQAEDAKELTVHNRHTCDWNV